MTVSAGVGGGSVGGVLVGGAATGGGGVTVIKALPFTGASDLMLMVALGVLLVIAGVLLLGLTRRHQPSGGTLGTRSISPDPVPPASLLTH